MKIIEIKSMPGIYKYSIDKLDRILSRVVDLEIPMVAIFPYTPENKKDNKGTESLNENNLVCKSIRMRGHSFMVAILATTGLFSFTTTGLATIFSNVKRANPIN